MKPGGQNPRGNAAPFGRYSNNCGAGFRRGNPPAAQHGFPASRPSQTQHGWSAARPIHKITKRPVVRGGGAWTFQGRGRFPYPPPGASGAAAPETVGELGHGQGVAPGAGVGVGGVGGVRGDGFDAPAPAGPSSGRQPSAAKPGCAAHGQQDKGQPGGHSISGGPVGL
uniref:Uncharacterized protein n=1 Tax=Oryza punctata TaxID=4537 RepID=A0A0E0K2X5_ORYPU